MRISRRAQEGFTLAGLIVLLTIIALIIAYTVPEQWSLVMKRERDRQTIFLMKQYARGILNWENKHRSLPVSLEQLQDAREPRMIRGGGKWICPINGKEDGWILVPPGAITPAGGVGQQGVPGLPGGPAGNPAGGMNTGGRKDRDNSSRIGIGMPDGGNQNQQQQQVTQGAGTFNPEASPADYVGPFVAVRPNATGKSFIALNGAEDYGEWVYSLQDLKNEIAMRAAALQAQ